MTINELLSNKHYRGNQTLLAKDLRVNRSTLRKYMADAKGLNHFIKKGAELELFTKVSGGNHTQLVVKD